MELVLYIGIVLLGLLVGELINHLIKYLQGQGKLCSVLSTSVEGGEVKWYEYTYFLQYILCKGKDKRNNAPLPKVYALAGFANALVYIGIYTVYHISVIGVIYGLCGSVLIILSVIDLRTFEIPIQLNVSILLLGLIRLGLDYENWPQYVIGFISVSGFLY
ncbi:MAG: prepilin peptidase, partial [Lachnospiraceae bacterium]|nr:prepilin peptidase [Lachnospiraceae bacterium]